MSLDKPQFEVNFRNWFTIGKTAKAMLYLHYTTSYDYGFTPVTTMGKDAYVYTQSIGLSLSYDFNTTRSKYKGTGAGNDEKNRL